MKRPVNKFGITVLAVAAAVAVLLSVMSYFSSTAAALPNLTGIIAAPFRSVAASLSDTVRQWTDYLTEFDALQAENEQLRLQIAQMEETVRRAEADRDENVRLRELTGLRQQRRDLQWESARVLVQDVSNWSSLLTINKGTSHGVESGDAVIDGTGGLVGVVREVGLNWCTVLTVVDTDTSLGAQVFRTKDLAIAAGNFSLMEQGRLRLELLPAGCQLLPGDLVQTSGLGDYYPSGLVIGTVEEILVDDSGAASYAILTPAADLSSLTEVFVIKSFDVVT